MPTLHAWKLSCLLLFSLLGCQITTKSTNPVTLAVLSNLEGVTEPCGCTSRPLGGLDRLVGRYNALAQKNPTGLLVVGNTFFTLTQPSVAQKAQETSKALVIEQILQRLNPLAIMLGPDDTGPMYEVLQSSQLPLWQLPQQTLVSLGGLQIGLIGVPGKLDEAFVTQAAANLRAQKADVVLLLLSQRTPEVRQLLPSLQGMDAIILAGPTKPSTDIINNIPILSAGSQGEFLGILQFVPQKQRSQNNSWQYVDDGTTHKAMLQAKRQRYLDEAQKLDKGPSRDARLAKIQVIDAELAKPNPTPPSTTAYFTWQTSAIEQHDSPIPWVQKALANYNRSLCATAYQVDKQRQCPPVPTPRERFVGSASCQACHQAAWQVYEKTAHARAWATLTNAGKECDRGCVGCHTVGYEKPGGFCRLQEDLLTYVNVGCENCHGPGGGHVDNPGQRQLWAPQFIRSPGVQVCQECHTPSHSDTFDFTTYLPRVLGPGHGLPPTTAPAAP